MSSRLKEVKIKNRDNQKEIESTIHPAKRLNNPEIGLVTKEASDEVSKYSFDPNIDPHLDWAGKEERTSFEIPLVSLHVHDRMEPQCIIEGFQRKLDQEVSLFHSLEDLPLDKAIEFYQHENNWTNRLIAGDSLLVMNSLLQKEHLAKSIQMVYVDPPYGISYRSNFQPFINKTPEGGDIDANITREPQQIQAFRDTWELKIHSYLSYLRDRLLLAYELLHDSGSCFVQIGDENLDLVAGLCAEIFGRDNRVATITVAKTSSSSSSTLPEVADYLIWYAKDKKQLKFHQMYESLDRKQIIDLFSWHAAVELTDGTSRELTEQEKSNPDEYLPNGARIIQQTRIDSMGVSLTGRSEPFVWNEHEYPCPTGSHWSVSEEGMNKLAEKNRLVSIGERSRLYRKRYESEVPGRQIHNIWWRQMAASNKKYVVETTPRIVERCMLMCTDPGDLVLDPTCGSGTTAFVAESWGRRWITCDTSRVAINLARQRLTTSTFNAYELFDEKVGIGSGYKYKTIKTPSTRHLAYDEPIPETILYDQPVPKRPKSKFVRVAGPFTIEAVPAPVVSQISILEEEKPHSNHNEELGISRVQQWCDELVSSNLRTQDGRYIRVHRVELLPETKWIHASGEASTDNSDESFPILVSFGPTYAPLDVNFVNSCLLECQNYIPQPKFVIFSAFQFDPAAAKRIDTVKWPDVSLLKVQMNSDLLTKDLRSKSRSADSFWLIGQPEIEVNYDSNDQMYTVDVLGFDYFDIESEKLISGDTSRIVMWMLDTDYNSRCFVPSSVYFPNTSKKQHNWRNLEKTLRKSIDKEKFEKLEKFSSIPFEKGEHERIAVKVIDDRGIESLRVQDLSIDRF